LTTKVTPTRGYGELELVPPETAVHAGECHECGREVETQHRLTRLLNRAVSQAGEVGATPVPRRIAARLAAAATFLLIVASAVAATLGWRAVLVHDQVATAVSAAVQPLQLRSTDPAQIQAWCEREAERPVPEISTAWLEPTGARMDREGGDEIVTVTYVTAQHRTIRVSWLDANVASVGARNVQARSVSGTTVLVVRSGAGTAVGVGRRAVGQHVAGRDAHPDDRVAEPQHVHEPRTPAF